MWLGEQVSERGIGNGISIIIATSILTGIPGAIGQALEQSRQGDHKCTSSYSHWSFSQWQL